MYNSVIMRSFQPGRCLQADGSSLADGQLSLLGNIVLQGYSLYKFHNNKAQSAVFPHIVHIHIVRVGKSGCSLRFYTKL